MRALAISLLMFVNENIDDIPQWAKYRLLEAEEQYNEWLKNNKSSGEGIEPEDLSSKNVKACR